MTSQAPLQVARQFDDPEQQALAATLGMWIFLATELLFFGPLFFGYLYGRTHLPGSFAAASRHTDMALGTLNTALLLTSSATMAMAVAARKSASLKLAQILLGATAVLGLAFLVIKGVEYRNEWREHLFPGAGFTFAEEPGRLGGAEMFFILYFMMTALHAIHLLVGIALTACFALALRRHADAFAKAERIELVGLYWHFVDVIWIFLYPLLYLVGRSGG